MKALLLDVSIPKVVLAKALGRRGARLAIHGPLSGLSLADVPEPPLPGPRWLRIEVIACGFCGSDLGAITYKASPVLTPWSSFPCVLGHEILGRVVEAGPGATRARVGQRVAVDPFLGCEVRELPHCASCREGAVALCDRQTAGPLPGMLLGLTSALPGGFAERMVLHDSQAVPLPDELPDDVGALVEPLGVGAHAVLRRPPVEGERVLVIGGGAIAFTTLAGLRLTGFAGEVTVACRTLGQAALAEQLGASRTFTSGGAALEDELAGALGLRLVTPLLGARTAIGGFDLVLDCVGSAESLSLALRFTRPRGAITLVGAAGETKVDLSFLWAKEITLHGTLGNGVEPAPGMRTLELVAQHAVAMPALAKLVTERVALEDHAAAVLRNLDRDRTGVVKTLFVPGPPRSTGAAR